jgi:hypothetical protein
MADRLAGHGRSRPGVTMFAVTVLTPVAVLAAPEGAAVKGDGEAAAPGGERD